MTSTNGPILILGLGELGTAVVLALASRTPLTHLTVLLRPESLHSPSPEKDCALNNLRALGVKFLAADLAKESVATLSALFVPFETVIGCTGFASGTPIQQKICEAVLQANVARYIPWQFGVDYDVIGRGSAQDLFDEQLDVRDLLRAQTATKWIIISTGMFTSFLFEPAFGVLDLKRDIVHALGSCEMAVTVTTAQDIGKLTAEILLSAPSIQDAVVYTAGDTLSYRRFCEIVQDVLGRPFKCEESSVSELEQDLSLDPTDSMRKYRIVFAKGKGVSWAKDQTFNAERDIEVTTVEQWAREHLKRSIR